MVVQRVGEVQEEVKSHANALLVDLEQMRKHDGYDQEWTFNTPIKLYLLVINYMFWIRRLQIRS
jgi:hypothetical protein